MNKKIGYVQYGAIALLTCCICLILTSIPLIAAPDWVVRSNESAELLSDAMKAQDCEKKIGVSGNIKNINPAFKSCRQKSISQAIQTLERKLAQAKDPELRFDLEILLESGRQQLRSYELKDKYRVPYLDLSKVILESLEDTLDEVRSPQKRQEAILTKLKQYAGLQPDTQALTSFLKQAANAQLQKSEFALPSKDLVEEDLDNNASQVSEILNFLRQQEIPDYQKAYAELKTQLFDYETFVRREILIRIEDNYRLPAELYAFELERQGIEIPIQELIQQGHTAFTQIQQQMDDMAQEIAQQRGIEVSGYRDMIQVLKQEQLSPQETLDLYRKRAKDIETILKRENLVTLPEDKFDIRLATAEEKEDRSTLAFYDIISNTVVLPVFSDPEKAKSRNDINNPATSWVLMVHEGRPGHDLQFATVQNSDLSFARTNFLRNASSHEGWATYAEIMMQPYLPLEGQFMSLRLQLLRAAHAFLGPELQLGKITFADAKKVMVQDLGFSRRSVEEDINGGVSESPGRSSAYFYGSQRLLQMRSQAEKMLGREFTPKKFHDFVLSQGFLTPKLLQQVFEEKCGNATNNCRLVDN